MIEFETMARPYAKALVSLSEKYNNSESWLEELSLLSIIASNQEVVNIITSPQFSSQEKANILISFFESQERHLDDLLKNFISFLADNNRLYLLGVIYNQYKKIIYARSDESEAIIYSAFEMNDNETLAIVDLLEKKLNKKLKVKIVVDSDLIGGIKVEYEDKVLDLSVKNQLLLLKKNILN